MTPRLAEPPLEKDSRGNNATRGALLKRRPRSNGKLDKGTACRLTLSVLHIPDLRAFGARHTPEYGAGQSGAKVTASQSTCIG